MRIKLLYSILMMMLIRHTYGQMDLGFRNIEQSRTVQDVWNINLSSHSTQILYFMVSVSSFKEGKVYEAKSNAIQLLAGSHYLKKELIAPITEVFVFPGFSGVLKGDIYQIKVQAIGYPGGMVLGEINSVLDMLNRPEKDSVASTTDKKINFGLMGSMSGQKSTTLSSGYEFSPSYFRIDAHPTLRVAEIPFTADLFYSTEQQNALGALNNYTFRIDYEQFKQNLIQKVTARTQERLAARSPEDIKFLQDLQASNVKDKYRHIDEWKAKLKDREFAQEVQLLSQYDRLSSLKSNPQIQSAYEKVDKTLDKYPFSSVQELEQQSKQLSQAPLDEFLELIEYKEFKNNPQALIFGLDSLYAHKDSLGKAPLLKDSVQSEKIKKLLGNQNFAKVIQQLSKKDNQELSDYVGFLKENKADIISGKFRQDIDVYKQYSELETALSDKSKKQIRQAKRWTKKMEAVKQSRRVDISQMLQEEENFNAITQKFGLLSKKEIAINSIKKLEVGTTYPDFSDLGMRGTLVKGYHIVAQSGKIYAASAMGKTEQFRLPDSIRTDLFNFNRFDKFVAANAVGWGEASGTGFRVSHIYIKEKGESFYDTLRQKEITPLTNHILLAGFHSTFFGKTTQLEGTLGYSFAAPAAQPPLPPQRGGLAETATQRVSDWAFMLKTGTNLPVYQLKWSIAAKYISPKYEALNVPFLFKDRLVVDAQLEKSVLENKIIIQFQYQYDKDSLHDLSKSTAIQTISSNINIQYPNMPYFQIGYTPILIKTNNIGLQNGLSNYNAMANVTAGYNYRLGEKKQTTGSVQVLYTYSSFYNTYLYNNYNDVINVSAVNYNINKIHTVSLNNTFNFSKINLQNNILMSYPTGNDTVINKIFSTQTLVSFRIKKYIVTTVGGSYSNELTIQNRWMGFVQLGYSFKQYFTIDARLEYNKFKYNPVLGNTENFMPVNGLLIRTQLRFRL